MKLPIKSINIFGKKHKIIAKDLPGLVGLHLPEESIIHIDKKFLKTCTKEEFMHVLLHECFHGLIKRCGIYDAMDEDFTKVEEVIAETFSAFVTESFVVRPR